MGEFIQARPVIMSAYEVYRFVFAKVTGGWDVMRVVQDLQVECLFVRYADSLGVAEEE